MSPTLTLILGFLLIVLIILAVANYKLKSKVQDLQNEVFTVRMQYTTRLLEWTLSKKEGDSHG